MTGTNRRMRYVCSSPMDNMAVIRISDDGRSYAIVAEKYISPTSELPSHLSIHDYLLGRGRNQKVVIHTHPIELVAMTHNAAFLGRDVLSRLLWSMIPETRAFCPKGVGIVPYALPGSIELADATIAQLDDYDVVLWEKHGALGVGENVIEPFDMIDTLSKSAQIYMSGRADGIHARRHERRPDAATQGGFQPLNRTDYGCEQNHSQRDLLFRRRGAPYAGR